MFLSFFVAIALLRGLREEQLRDYYAVAGAVRVADKVKFEIDAVALRKPEP